MAWGIAIFAVASFLGWYLKQINRDPLEIDTYDHIEPAELDPTMFWGQLGDLEISETHKRHALECWKCRPLISQIEELQMNVHRKLVGPAA